ncbi:hypothetical protein fh0823_20730 [Francisella halioticida]|uniref:hypothetical protein n=1 Tax=Francisella halioticida TaxID=549298 RepID=UPI0012FCA36F|nr:hypothetical protein [Francisella halioticida]BCD91326.1 hypothetical protein fh0823_14650 [Francisella halioticida]BCD91595.1 hypothetical protein fh0823_17340 [Francisella halioticida]BCD91934.1 hypothetical protein fh0823_20730 [Francisella halioticida]
MPVTTLCKSLNVSTSSYYRWIHKPIDKRQYNDAELDDAILMNINLDMEVLGYTKSLKIWVGKLLNLEYLNV